MRAIYICVPTIFRRPQQISKAIFPRTLKPTYVTSCTIYRLEKRNFSSNNQLSCKAVSWFWRWRWKKNGVLHKCAHHVDEATVLNHRKIYSNINAEPATVPRAIFLITTAKKNLKQENNLTRREIMAVFFDSQFVIETNNSAARMPFGWNTRVNKSRD